MKTEALLDTSVVIDYLRGKPEAVTFVERFDRPPSVSVITVAEISAGLRGRQEESAADLLLQVLRIHPIELDIARRAGSFLRHYQRSHALDLVDALIAATADCRGLRLATLNVKHFPMFSKLRSAY